MWKRQPGCLASGNDGTRVSGPCRVMGPPISPPSSSLERWCHGVEGVRVAWGEGTGTRLVYSRGRPRALTPAFTVVHAWTNHHTKPTSTGGKGSEQVQRDLARHASAHQHTRAVP